MTLAWIERGLRLAGGLAILFILTWIFAGLQHGLRQRAGRTSGRTAFLRSPAFYIINTLLYFGFCVLIWRPLRIPLTNSGRILFLVFGSLVFFAGLALVLWARIALGKFYFGSTTFGAQLFEQHRLIKHGPFAFIRHPMYLGLFLTGLGGILLYQIWTMVFLTLITPGLALRARREEQVLFQEFGEEWLEYSRRVPPWLPRLTKKPLGITTRAILELIILFLPAITAYLWFWPTADEITARAGEIIVYVYFALGALWIGRHWTLERLGINRRGIWLGLICGLLLVLARTLVILGVLPAIAPPSLSFGKLIGQIAFYLGLVGLVEELLFRGLIYRVVEDWRGERWAVWISSLAFGLWHIFGQGPLVGAATFLYGLIFALIRLRGGGIIGLIFAHGLMDLATVWIISPDALLYLSAGRTKFSHPFWVVIGMLIFIQVPIYLWRIHPLISEFFARITSSEKSD